MPLSVQLFGHRAEEGKSVKLRMLQPLLRTTLTLQTTVALEAIAYASRAIAVPIAVAVTQVCRSQSVKSVFKQKRKRREDEDKGTYNELKRQRVKRPARAEAKEEKWRGICKERGRQRASGKVTRASSRHSSAGTETQPTSINRFCTSKRLKH